MKLKFLAKFVLDHRNLNLKFAEFLALGNEKDVDVNDPSDVFKSVISM